MRLLIADEEIIAGGVETLRNGLVPALAPLCDAVVWVLPVSASHLFREQVKALPNVQIEHFACARTHPLRIVTAFARRCPGQRARQMFHRLTRRQTEARLDSLARRHRSTHFLTTCIFSQPYPQLALPGAGFVCDVNPALPAITRANICNWVRRAPATFAISEFTAGELRRCEPTRADRIHSIPLAPPSPPSGDAPTTFDFYYPAAANPHKGHATLFAACALVARRGYAFRLVLSGPGTEVFRSERMPAYIDVRGNLPPEEVRALFTAAHCIVLPTTYEGFGLPLTEALRHGKPVVCSDIPPLIEQLDRYASHDRARVVPPNDAERLATALEQQLSDPLPPLPLEEIDRRLARWTWFDAACRCRDLLNALAP